MLDDFTEQAIPHEAGHIIVGWSLRWIPIRELVVDIIRHDHGNAIGHFRTASIEPTDRGIALTPPDRLREFKIFVAGGLAGNRVSGIPAADESLQSDRISLARVGSESLEQMADEAEKIINSYLESFQRLRSAIRQAFEELITAPSLCTDCYTLLTREEILYLLAS